MSHDPPSFYTTEPSLRSLHEPDPSVEVPEALVHDLWRHQRFNTEALATTDDKPVQIFDPGRANDDAGPDFANAHVRLGDMDWRGDVEIHTHSGGWFTHEHHTDPRYNRVVLHVTLRSDMWTGGLLRPDESPLPELVLAPHLDTSLRKLLHAFHTRPDSDALPCAARWDEVPTPLIHDWVTTLADERLETKQARLASPAGRALEASLHERLFAGLGYAKNDGPMSVLAERLPPDLVRSVESPRDREALHFGVAGLLPSPGDLLEADRPTADYAMDLRHRFRRLQVRLNLPVMEGTTWTFFRLRPSNFPPLRIAQAVAWYDAGALLSDAPLPRLRESLTSDAPAQALRDALAAEPSPFWNSHYRLTKPAAQHASRLGASRRNTLLVNAVAPVLLLDAKKRSATAQAQAVRSVLASLSAPHDVVVQRFNDLGTEAGSAYEAQGLHQLYREYCTKGRCLDCAIGQHLLGA
ncbi:MAG: DUF2851 family protein [Salinibacter sp.]